MSSIKLPGTGLDVGTDKIDGIDYQIIKLAIGANGEIFLISNANPMPIDVKSLPVDENGAIGGVKLLGKYWNDSSFRELGAEATDWGFALPVLIANYLGTNDVPVAWSATASVGAIDNTALVNNGPNTCDRKSVAISCSGSGNNTVVAAVPDYKIRVLALSLSASAAVNAKFQSGAGGTDLTGLYYLAANGGMVLPYNKLGWFETGVNALLNLNLSGAIPVGGCITYIEV
jgi:hypothetical protein